MSLPMKVNHMLAVSAVEDFLNDSDWQAQIKEYNWNILLKEELTLVVSLTARELGGTSETFTLRLTCDYYPMYPPDVQFVNPITHMYILGKDHRHVADLRAPYCYTHLNYPYQAYPYGPQLICSSMILGYYFSNHVPTPEQVWLPERHSIGTSIYTIYRALHSSDYYGRHTG